MKMHFTKSLIVGLLFVVGSGIVLPAYAVAQPGRVATSRPSLERTDLEPWLDGQIEPMMELKDAAGVVVTIVKDGRIVLSKGYGFLDIAQQRRVDPDHTLFRIGSISKTFTWIAVMQLVAAGKIDLDRDVNLYLDIKIPTRDGGPITMRHLMTHRAGFEEIGKSVLFYDPQVSTSLREWVKTHVPARIFPAGTTPAYSNYGAALAGYIVQRVSGEPFDRYVAQHILVPLEMNGTFAQPLPAGLKNNMAKGYVKSSAPPKPFELLGAAPMGAGSFSGADMARFMVALLQDGPPGRGQILKPETMALMRQPAPGIGPLPRSLLGFYEIETRGHRSFGHGGDTQWMHSQMTLYPADGIGIFMSVNGPADWLPPLMESFHKRYFGVEPASACLATTAASQNSAMLAQSYTASRRSETSWASIINLLSGVTIKLLPSGRVTSDAFRSQSGDEVIFCNIAPLVWRAIHPTDAKNMASGQTIAANAQNGRITAFGGSFPNNVYLPTPWWKSPEWLVPAAIAALAVFGFAALSGPVGAFARWRNRSMPIHASNTLRIRRWSTFAAILVIGLCVIIVTPLSTIEQNLELLVPSSDVWLLLLQGTTFCVLLLSTVVSLKRMQIEFTLKFSWIDRMWSVMMFAASVVLSWIAIVFHLIDMNVAY